jgi:hypothetical protein
MPSSNNTAKNSNATGVSGSNPAAQNTGDRGSATETSKSSAEVLEEEHQQRIQDFLTSHGGYLAKPIRSLSTSLDCPPQQLVYAIAFVYLLLHLVLPAFLLPHLSALVTLIIPVQCTMRSISLELKKGGPSAARDSSQWLGFWVVYCLFGLIRGWVGVCRPGYKAGLEIARTAGLCAVGGPWFGRDGLVSRRAEFNSLIR